MGKNNTSKNDNSVLSKSEETLTCEELLKLVTSFHKPEITLEKCGYCVLMSRNLQVHKRLNHSKRKSVRFSGSSPKKNDCIGMRKSGPELETKTCG